LDSEGRQRFLLPQGRPRFLLAINSLAINSVRIILVVVAAGVAAVLTTEYTILALTSVVIAVVADSSDEDDVLLNEDTEDGVVDVDEVDVDGERSTGFSESAGELSCEFLDEEDEVD